MLRDVFAVPFEQIAPVLGRSEVATRQLASRARRRLREPEPREDLAAADAAVVDAFMQASRDNEFAALLDLLDPEAAVRVDDAALAMGGDARAVRVSRRWRSSSRAGPARPCRRRSTAPRPPAGSTSGEVKVVFGFTVVDDKVVQIEVLADPRVLTRAARRSPAR